MLATRVIVTRPAADAAHWVQQLQQSGFEAEALPLIEIASASAGEDVAALKLVWQTLGSYAACLFVSGNAVEHFFKQKRLVTRGGKAQAATEMIANGASEQQPSSLRFLAPGPGTVAALVAAGVPVDQIDAPSVEAPQFDSQALWAVVGSKNWQGQRVLIVRGQSESEGKSAAAPGRDWIARQWQAAGATVDFVSVYQRRAPDLSHTQLQRAEAASADGSIWLFSSSEAISNLVLQADLSAARWHHARAVATHPRIADAARSAGWGVVMESRPALQDIKCALRSIESPHP